MNLTLTLTLPLTLLLPPPLTLTLALILTLTLTLPLTPTKVSDARLRPEWASLSADDEAHTAWKAPELLLATFDTSALLLDASGGGVASTATARPSNHHPDPNPDPNPDPYPGPNQAASAFALPVTERADVYAFGMTCYEVPSP